MALNLDSHQRIILAKLVEASRRVPDEVRPSFFYQHAFGEPHPRIEHPGLRERLQIAYGDMEAMARAGLLSHRRQIQGYGHLDLMPTAFEAYTRIQTEDGNPISRVQEEVRQYLDAASFRVKFGQAYDAWKRAAELLWGKEHTTAQLSTIGHLCREAMQEFAAVLVGAPQRPAPDPDRAKTVDRVREVLRNVPSKSDKAFLDALLTYWGTVADLVQRLEHAGAKDGEVATWDDARRAVFQTAIVMYELSTKR